jgi:hypothetical protein
MESSFHFPTPANGSQYLLSEVVSLLVDSQLKGRKHAKQYLIINNLVPVETVNAVGKVMRNTGGDPLKAPAWWGNIGKPPICSPSEFIQDFDVALLNNGTSTVGDKEAHKLLIKKKQDSLRWQDIEPASVTVSNPTKWKYDAMVKMSNNTVVVPATHDTTETHETAGKSLIVATLFAACMMDMAYQQCEINDANEWKFPTKVTDGAREAYKS